MWWITDILSNCSLAPSRKLGRRHRLSTNTVWWVGVLLSALVLLTCSYADPSQDGSECGAKQYKCYCGVPRCIAQELVKNGEKDCKDGSDEGQWDPSKCAIKNTTSEDIRFKRAAISELSRLRNGDATTTFFGGERGRTRPVGLLSTSLGSFVTSGTTTEYVTKILGTYIKGTYARIISTSSRIYHAVPTDSPGMTDGVRPTGLIASTVSTEINGYATTAHTTDFYRTYIDGTYAQLVSSYSQVDYPPWYTDKIVATAVASAFGGEVSDIKPSTTADAAARAIYATPVVHLPVELNGNFIASNLQSKAYAELSIVSDNNENSRLRALRPNGNADNELRVTGTHGKFVHTEVPSGEETTYNVFTGSYLQNSKTFLFFFGNTVISPSKSASGEQDQTILVENGSQRKNNVVVDMSKNLKVIVPSKNNRAMIDGSIDGKRMEGVVVEIEGSEPVGNDEEFISVDGAHKQISGTPSDPKIDMVTVTLDKKPKTRVSTSSSSSSSTPKKEVENEIAIGRRVGSPSAARLIRPSPVSVSLPTFTVGQPDRLEFEEEASTQSSNKDRVVKVETSSSSSSGKKSGAPVFNKPTTERTTQRTTSKKSYTPTLSARNVPDRNHRAFKGLDNVAARFNDVDSDLQSAASTGRATVTYVGFADFTTTVGNTVIVFMPRTKMIEDLSVHATKTQEPSSPVVAPTRLVYQTDEDEPVATTPRRVENEHVRFSVSQSTGPSKAKSFSASSSVYNEREDDETTTEIAPSDTTVTVSGTQTVLSNLEQRDSSILLQKKGAKTLLVESDPTSPTPVVVSPTSSSGVLNRRNSLFSNSNRQRFTPKLSRTVMLDEAGGEKTKIMSSKDQEVLSTPTFVPRKSSSAPGVYATASTAVFQTDQLNPTGLVTSIVGTVVKDSTTTLYTSLVYGTFIGSSYAQVIKSTSKVYFILPSKAAGDSSSVASPSSSRIRPTPVAKFSRPSATASVYSYEVTTTESTNDEVEGETTTERKQPDLKFKSPFDTNLDRMEVSVSTTTDSSRNRKNKNKPKPAVIEDEDEEPTTTGRVELEDSYYDEVFTTTEKDETENEIDTRRKVQGTPQEQIIVDKDQLEATPAQDDDEQTIYVTRTLPTTVYRTYTYYTTFFIPKDETTLTSVISREVTSSHKGLVRKTFTNFVNPTDSVSDDVVATKEVKPQSSSSKSKSRGVKVRPSSSQIIYKTFFTTYTYLTTFFTGQTSSVSSREEIVSNVVTLTHGPGSGSSSTSKIEPTSSYKLSSSLRTASPRLSSSARQGGSTAAGASSSLQSSRGGKYSVIKRPKPSSSFSSPVAPEASETPELKSPVYVKKIEPSSLTTILKTFYTTYTYFTTLFDGAETSIKSRTEVLTNVVPTVGRFVPASSSVATTSSPVLNTASITDDYNYYDEEDKVSSSAVVVSKNKGSSQTKDKETTFYTTYTYLTTLTRDGSSQLKSSLETYSNVVIGDSTIKSGYVKTIEPTKLSGRSAATQRVSLDDDLNGVGSHLSETSETTVKDSEPDVTTVQPQRDYYELEGSEGVTTDKSVYDEHELESDKANSADDDDSENQLKATPALKTYFTTFTFFTTYYKGSSSTISSRLETVTNVVSEGASSAETSETSVTATVDPTYPITYFTTYTYWTTSFKDGSNVVNSREETISNVVTPGVDDVAQTTKTKSGKAISATENNEIVPTASVSAAAASEVELTTYFTTYTYFTTSYMGESTVVHSHLETITNVISGTATVTDSAVVPTASLAGRAISNGKSEKQQVASSDKESEYQEDYDLPTGLLSTVVSSEVVDRTTTLYSTDVYGTYIDGIYAQVLESTSNIITPTASAETKYMPDATDTSTGVVSVNEGKTVDANGVLTTYYTTMAYGTVIDGKYAHLVESTSSIKKNPDATLDPSEDHENPHKTGLVRVIDGTLVEGDQTTFYTSSILGTIIDGQYAQVIESTSRYVISPTKTDDSTTSSPTKSVEIESSITEGTTEEIPTTTEKETEQEEEEDKKKAGVAPPRKFGLNSRSRQGSRLSFTTTSKSFTPQITPFAARSRPASGFVPRRRQSSSAVIVTRTDEVTPTVTATLAAGTSRERNSFQARKRFQKPGTTDSTEGTTGGTSSNSVTTPTPKLPYSSRGTSRFQRPGVSGARAPSPASNAVSISPSSASGGGGSSPGARGRSSYSPRGSSVSGARGRGSSTGGFSRGSVTAAYGGSSSAGNRGASSSRFAIRGRGSSVTASIQPTSVSTTVKPTEAPLASDEEEYEIEYEYEVQSPSSSSTTEAPKTTSRFSGGNRFRGGLNPKLSTPSGVATTQAPTSPTTRGLPFLRRQNFAKPTFPTRGTTASTSSTTAEYEEEYEEEEVVKPAAVPTKKPTSPLIKRPGGLVITQRPTSRATVRARTSTTVAPPVSTTTRKLYSPRARPAGFPRPVGLTKPPSTTSTEKVKEIDEDLYEDGEFEYEESRHVPNVTIGAASEIVETRIEAPKSVVAVDAKDETVAAGRGDLAVEESAPAAVRVAAPDGKHTVNVDDLVDSGSEFFGSAVAAPYESYDYMYSDDNKGSNGGSSLLKRSVRQVTDNSYGYYNFGARVSRGTLRSNFNSRVRTPSTSNSQPNSRATTYVNSDYDDYYYDDAPAAPSTTAAPARANRFRGRTQIQPTSTSRRTPFTLTNSDSTTNTRSSSPTTKSRTSTANSRTSSANTNTRTPPSYTRRSQSRFSRPTEATTTSRSSRFRSRYNSGNSRETTTAAPTYNSRSRFTANTRGRGTVSNARVPVYEEPSFQASTITITHYVPAETSVPFVNGKSTEYKTIITPSPSIEVVSPFQYTQVDYLGKPALVLNSELTSTPSFGVTEITRFFIRESSTTSVTFTPTTIRGRKTSFSHIIPSTVYSVEPVVSTITNNVPLSDNNQLTNLLLNQLLGQGLLNPNLLALQQQQQHQLPLNNEPATPVTHYNTKTTSYVTTVTDYTSTVIPITLHGKAIKTTIVESSSHVITATEFITESTVITPTNTQPQHHIQQTHPAGVLNQLNPALLQGLLQSQLLQQQQNQLLFKQPIQPTQPAQLQLPTQTQQPQIPQLLNLLNNINSNNANLNNNNVKQENDQEDEPEREEERNAPPQQKPENNVIEASKPAGVPPGSSVVTLYVSGRNPGEFSTVLQTVAIEGRKKRSVVATLSESGIAIEMSTSAVDIQPSSATISIISSSLYTLLDSLSDSDYSNTGSSSNLELPVYLNSYGQIDSHDESTFVDENSLASSPSIVLDDSYSFSDAWGNSLDGASSRNSFTNSYGNAGTQSLDSVLGDDNVSSRFHSQSVSAAYA